MHINRLTLCGRLTKDPELKTTNSGKSLCNITVATEYIKRGRDGGETKEVCFTSCTLWDNVAKMAMDSLHKGSLVTLDGRLKQESWKDKDSGEERFKHAMAVETIVFMEPRELVKKAEFVERSMFDSNELPF